MANDGPFRPTPEEALRQEPTRKISEHGRKALSIIRGGLIIYPEYPPELRLGYLGNIQKKCRICLKDIYAFRGNFRGEPPYIAGQNIYFEKEMIIGLLSRIKPGKTTRASGEAVYEEYLRTFGPSSLDSKNPYSHFRNIEVPVRLNLRLGLSEDSKEVIFYFSTKETERLYRLSEKLVFKERKRVEKPKPKPKPPSFFDRLFRRK